MANLKLSQLPVAAPLAGAELVPLVQGGQTKAATLTAIANMRRGAWQLAQLEAPWIAFGDPFAAPAYRNDGSRVYLRGLIKGGAGGSTAFRLPAGLRPPMRHLFACTSDQNEPTRIDITAIGDVIVVQPLSGTVQWLSLDGIAFCID